MRFAVAMIVMAILMAAAGCDRSDGSSQSQTSSSALPAEYRVVAAALGQDAKFDPNEFRDDKGMSQIIAEGHAAVMDLSNCKSSDQDISYIASQGREAFAAAIQHLERINSLPKPAGTGEIAVESFIHGLYGNVYAGYALGADADSKRKAIADEVTALFGAVDKADGVHLLLPKVAQRFAPAPVSDTSMVIDCDESWYGWGPYDWCKIYNAGSELHDATLVVELKGLSGESRTNVHFVKTWPAKTWLYCRYDPGKILDGRAVGRMTVSSIQSVTATVYSPARSVTNSYVYAGRERDKDIAEYCKGLKLSWRYQPFDKGIIFADTQRGVKLTPQDGPSLGKCRVDVSFTGSGGVKSWYWELDSWPMGEEKIFATPPGQLTFDPTSVQVKISFPGTTYAPQWDLKMQ